MPSQLSTEQLREARQCVERCIEGFSIQLVALKRLTSIIGATELADSTLHTCDQEQPPKNYRDLLDVLDGPLTEPEDDA